MNIAIEAWHIVTLVSGVIASLAGFAMTIYSFFRKQRLERDTEIKTRTERDQGFDSRLNSLEDRTKSLEGENEATKILVNNTADRVIDRIMDIKAEIAGMRVDNSTQHAALKEYVHEETEHIRSKGEEGRRAIYDKLDELSQRTARLEERNR